MLRHGWLVALVFGCGSAQSGNPCDVTAGGVVSTRSSLTKLRGCKIVRGDLIVTGAALTNLDPLEALVRVEGNLRIGPTLGLVSTQGLSRLEEVTGSLLVVDNASLQGIYFAGLRQVRGEARVENNYSIHIASLHNLRRVGGVLRVADNRDLFRADFSRLASVGQHIEIVDNRALATFAVGGRISVGGNLLLRDNEALSSDVLELMHSVVVPEEAAIIAK